MSADEVVLTKPPRAERERCRHSCGRRRGYQPDTIVVAAGEPARLVFHRHDASRCSEQVVFPDQGVRATLPQHQDVEVQLPASAPGEYEFHCGMKMLHGRLVVR